MKKTKYNEEFYEGKIVGIEIKNRGSVKRLKGEIVSTMEDLGFSDIYFPSYMVEMKEGLTEIGRFQDCHGRMIQVWEDEMSVFEEVQ